MLLWLSRISFAAALILLALAAYGYCTQPPEVPVVIDEPERTLAEHPTGPSTVTFQLHNHTRRPIQVVGLAHC